MFFDINKNLCEVFTGLNPLELLDYPAEDVFNLIDDLLDYNKRQNKDKKVNAQGKEVIRVKAGDNWV
jgi:hypothetical protein